MLCCHEDAIKTIEDDVVRSAAAENKIVAVPSAAPVDTIVKSFDRSVVHSKIVKYLRDGCSGTYSAQALINDASDWMDIEFQFIVDSVTQTYQLEVIPLDKRTRSVFIRIDDSTCECVESVFQNNETNQATSIVEVHHLNSRHEQCIVKFKFDTDTARSYFYVAVRMLLCPSE